MRGLYAIVDLGTLKRRGIDPLDFARALIEARPAVMQLRAKDALPRETLSILRALGPMCRQARVPLVCNDRADLAVLAGCDMVHVGQTDAAPEMVRRIAPGLGFGVSTHDIGQLEAALATHPTYVAYGPIFDTKTKIDPDPVVGIDGLKSARRVAGHVPLVAIGGITIDNACEVAEFADMGAVVTGLLDEAANDFGSVTKRARALHQRLGGAA
jgi:thiamine-phosphate pyrophosphorylase